MTAYACVTTAKGIAAISSIQLAGESAGGIVREIFKPAGGDNTRLKAGAILTGDIYDGRRIIDHVVIACENTNDFAINCHGNPIIVEMIMTLLKDKGARLISVEYMLARQFSRQEPNTIAAEARVAQLAAVTLEGVKIIATQITSGLAETAAGWLANFDDISLDDIAETSRRILADSLTAGLIINGTKAVISGPPNSGKSTLLNCLCGKEKAVVTDIAGTTRDWISGVCRLDSLLIDFVDTAGIENTLAQANSVDKQSQQRAKELLAQSDLVLLVLDSGVGADNGAAAVEIVRSFAPGKKMLVVLNKSDLPGVLDAEQLDFDLGDSVTISAKNDSGIKELAEKIRSVLGVADFDLTSCVCFTPRQKKLLGRLTGAKTKADAKSTITELLNGGISV
jgi:tRNA modification GTPase